MTAKRTALVVAVLVYAASFFLPAVQDHEEKPNIVLGYTCALNTLVRPWEMEDWRESVPFFLAGCTNPALLLYGLTFLWRRPRARRVFRVLVVAFLLSAWWTIYSANVVPLIGHFLWAGSIIALLVWGLGRVRTQEAAVTSPVAAA